MYDVSIIGAGPAGMTAAIYCARKQLTTMIITKDTGGQTLLSSNVENYLGYQFIQGTELVKKFEEHLETFAIGTEYNAVKSIIKDKQQFVIETDKGKTYQSHTSIIASGKSSKRLNVPGEEEFISRGVSYCATCDAPLFQGKEVAVIGGGNSGLDAVIQLTGIASKVYLIESDSKLRADIVYQSKAEKAPNVDILTNTQVKEIKGDLMVSAIIVTNRDNDETREIPVEGIFIEIGLKPNISFAPEALKMNQNNEIIIDKRGKTNIDGLFAAGDVTDTPEKQIIIAAGEGAKAALGAYEYLVRSDLILTRSAPT